MANTPMMVQYREIKARHQDCILFFRLGDFYEMFDEDARLASKELDLVLTTRDKSSPEDQRTPMCGVPYHSADAYIARLISRGYKVAICEQTEDPKLAKGLVERDIVRIVTPGTATSSTMLDETRNNFVASVYEQGKKYGVAFCDLSTGEMYAAEVSASTGDIENEFARFSPSEAVLSDGCADLELRIWLRDRLNCSSEYRPNDDFIDGSVAMRQFGGNHGLDGATLAAVTGLLNYLHHTQKTDLTYINHVEVYTAARFLELDITARRNLELCETLRTGDKRGSLLWVLDRTETSMGARCLRAWLEKPLRNPAEIGRRHAAVDTLVKNAQLRDSIRDELKGVTDIERIVGRVVYGSAGGRDLRSLAQAAAHIAPIRQLVSTAKDSLMQELSQSVDPLDDITTLINSAIADEPPFSVREGGFIRDGYDAEVDRLRTVLAGGRGGVAAIEAAEREKTGIKALKVGYNRVFGYYIEVRKTSGDAVPAHYVRKQTLADRERYITQELKEMETEILTAEERLSALEHELFEGLRDKVSQETARIQRTARAVAAIDVLRSFAQVAADNNYCYPTLDEGDRVSITDGRHPVVERMLDGGLFVPNDVLLDRGENLAAIITGPNMAGKSTYMRQVAIIVLMAQAGSFVPARSAHIGVVDRIFTRIGASDDLASGMSTFMVEMSEVAEMLRSATSKSLLILDEIGRGTSTFDGMAIARAVLEWVGDKKRLGAKTLFATHYHELTELENQLDGVKNYNIAAKKRDKDIVFLRKIVRGGADDSYGIEVARLAGIPEPVIDRATEILTQLESSQPKTVIVRQRDDDPQVTFGSLGGSEIADTLKLIDLNVLTPIEAMNKLYELKKLADSI